jgi:hypothetical protein
MLCIAVMHKLPLTVHDPSQEQAIDFCLSVRAITGLAESQTSKSSSSDTQQTEHSDHSAS